MERYKLAYLERADYQVSLCSNNCYQMPKYGLQSLKRNVFRLHTRIAVETEEQLAKKEDGGDSNPMVILILVLVMVMATLLPN
uniref:Uncharacterized protein n=1 Tax=Setaria digitata TaxID=48799 RepID=A0A915Q525_9BILA